MQLLVEGRSRKGKITVTRRESEILMNQYVLSSDYLYCTVRLYLENQIMLSPSRNINSGWREKT